VAEPYPSDSSFKRKGVCLFDIGRTLCHKNPINAFATGCKPPGHGNARVFMAVTGWFARDLRGPRAKARKESEPIEDPASRIMMESWSREGKVWSDGIMEYWVEKFCFSQYSIIPTFQLGIAVVFTPAMPGFFKIK